MCKEIRLKKFLVVLVLTFVFSQMQSDVFAQDNLPSLELNEPTVDSINTENSKSYQINLSKGQYVHIFVNSKEVNFKLSLYNQNNQKLYEKNSSNRGTKEAKLFWLSENDGKYRIEVSLREKNKKSGKFSIVLKDFRDATPQDVSRVKGEKLADEAKTLMGVNKNESRQNAINKYLQAIEHFKVANAKKSIANALNNIGFVYRRMSQFPKALEYLKQSLQVSKEINDKRLQAVASLNIGHTSITLGNWQASRDAFENALQISEEIKDTIIKLTALNGIGVTFFRVGKYAEALNSFEKVLEVFVELKQAVPQASMLNNIAKIKEVQGDFDKALRDYNKALKIFESVNNKRGKADILLNAGRINIKLLRTTEAFESLNAALKLYREIENLNKEAAVLHSLGSLHNNLGDYAKALSYFTRANEIAKKVKNLHAVASTSASIGVYYINTNEYKKALPFIESSLNIARKIKNRRGEAYSLNHLGTAYLRLKNYQKAQENYQKALDIFISIGDREGESESLYQLGWTHNAKNENELSAKYFTEALNLSRLLKTKETEAKILREFAILEEKRGDNLKAKSLIKEAIATIETLRDRVPEQGLKAAFFSNKDAYSFYIELLLKENNGNPSEENIAKALEAFEKSKARSLIEIIGETRSKIYQGVSKELLAKKQNLQAKLNLKEMRRMRLLGSKAKPQQIESIEKEIQQLLIEYQQIKIQIRSQNPQYASLTQPKPISLKGIQSLLDNDTVLLEYYFGIGKSFVWIITNKSIKGVSLAEKNKIYKDATKFFNQIKARNTRLPNETRDQLEKRIEKTDKEIPITALNLSKQIIHPIQKDLNKKRIVVVADRFLQYIPFGTLAKSTNQSKNKYQPLILGHEIVNLPSSSTLSVLRDRNNDKQTIPNSVAIIADPVFSQSDSRVAESIAKLKNKVQTKNVKLNVKPDDSLVGELKRSANDLSINQFRRLRFSRREANDISSFADKNKQLKAVDFAADRDFLLKQDLSKYQILHFATHGLLNNKNPELSGIVLSLVDKNGKPKDGFLRLHEIYNMQIGADLVVLSACQTALGKNVHGEGLIGLTRGFMYAGAESVVASLWQVEDRATAELMKRFYSAMLKDRLKPAAALRKAQVEMIKENRWKNPYYWAAFTLQGEWK